MRPVHHVEYRDSVLTADKHIIPIRLARDRNQLTLEGIDVLDKNSLHHVREFQGAITANGSDLGTVKGERGAKDPSIVVRNFANLLAGCNFEYVNRVICSSES